jgi:amidase
LALYSRRAIAATSDLAAVLTPTLAMLPRPIGWFDSDGYPAADFERQKRYTPFTAVVNATGQPAISLPMYQSREGLPIGIMLVGRPADEVTLLALGAQLEAAVPWRERHPAIWTA